MERPSLAERLGYGADDRLLIVNCDDLGSSHSANLATHRAMTAGVATSATLMVPCPWALEAATLFEGFPVGIHLTVTSEHQGYRWRPLTPGASLRDADGFCHATTAAALETITEADARAECRAQIEAALAWGVDATHLDTHMNVVQGRSDLFEIYLDLAVEFGIPVRMFSRDDTDKQGFRARERADERGVLFNDHIIYPWPRRTRDVFFETMPNLHPGVTEIFVHPVLDGDELRGYDKNHIHIRTHDAECLVDPSVADLLQQHGIQLISYRRLRDLQRSSQSR